MPQLKEVVKQMYADYPDEARKLFGENPFELKNVLKLWVRNQLST